MQITIYTKISMIPTFVSVRYLDFMVRPLRLEWIALSIEEILNADGADKRRCRRSLPAGYADGKYV